MNRHLVSHVDAWLDRAANFVIAYMPVDVTVDTAYEEMLRCTTINTEAMLAAFSDAVKYLQPQGQFKRFNATLPDKRIATIQARFTPTPKWPMFLIPEQNFTIDPESKFAALLDTPIRVATEWIQLEYIWQQLRQSTHALSNEQLVYLMPWIRECLADFDITSLPVEVKLTERRAIDKEHAPIMRDANVLFFPRLSKSLMAVARSGRVLISQYRMIEAAYAHEQLVHSPLSVDRAMGLVEPWVREHFTEAMDEWRLDRNHQAERQLAVVRAREIAKLDKFNPKSK
jgi:hypothetical protein